MYSHALDRTLTGVEILSLQGLPVADVVDCLTCDPQPFSEKDLHHLAGQGMGLPSVGMILLAYILNSHGPWWNKRASAEA